MNDLQDFPDSVMVQGEMARWVTHISATETAPRTRGVDVNVSNLSRRSEETNPV